MVLDCVAVSVAQYYTVFLAKIEFHISFTDLRLSIEVGLKAEKPKTKTKPELTSKLGYGTLC